MVAFAASHTTAGGDGCGPLLDRLVIGREKGTDGWILVLSISEEAGEMLLAGGFRSTGEEWSWVGPPF